MSATSLSQSQDKVLARPYKCPYPECGRAFSRLEHQVHPIFRMLFLIISNHRTRLATSVHTPGRSHLLAISRGAKNVSLAPMSSHAIRGYTTMTDMTRVEPNPGQRTLLSHPSSLPPLDRTTDTPSLLVESRRRLRVVPTATTRCGNRHPPLFVYPHPFIVGRILLSTHSPLSGRFHNRHHR